MISIINYGLGNIKAILNIFNRLNIEASVISTSKEIKDSKKLILPGVGSFDEAMKNLNKSGLRDSLDKKVLIDDTPIIGICIGMQIMAKSSEEGKEKGLGWFEESYVRKFDEKNILHKPKFPHMGWNSIKIMNENKILNNINAERGFYFLHSYFFDCIKENILTTTSYGHEFPSAINKKNIFGFQFHPEKSHKNGEILLKNFSIN